MRITVQDKDQERLEVMGLLDHWNKTRNSFNVVAVMNLNCNFSCVYCYEGDRKNPNLRMSFDTADKLEKFILKNREDDDNVRIDFYGGEPLLDVPMIRYISEKMATMTQQNGKLYEFYLVTNGSLLTEKVLDTLIPLGLRGIKITLDGPKDIHDKQRPYVHGKGSFDDIIRNVKLAYERTNIQIGGNFSRHNYSRFPELLDYLLEQGIDPKKLVAVKFAPITEPESKNLVPSFGSGCRSINEPWLFEAVILLRQEILSRGFSTPSVAMGPCTMYFGKEYVVNHDGALYKCPGFLCHQKYAIGCIDDDKPGSPEAYKLDLWKNERCRDCSYLPLCFGGCRYMEFINTGEIGINCKLAFYEATLKYFLEQDAKYSEEK